MGRSSASSDLCARRTPFALSARLIALGCLTQGCSFLYDFGADQCQTTADCASLGGEFSDRVCVEGICQVELPDCTTNAECLDAPGNFGASACIASSCQALTTPECPVVLPVTDDLYLDNLRSEDPLILGGYAFIPPELIGNQIRNYDLALTEFTNQAGGLLGPGGTRRQLVMVVCQAVNADETALDRSMVHLADTLGVPGMISAMLAEDLQQAFETQGLDSDMFFMSPLEADSTLVTLQDDGLIWHIGPGGGAVAEAYAPLLDRTLAYLSLDGPVRVALVTASDVRYLSDVASTVQSTVTFNGKSVIENLNDGNFLPISVDSVYLNPDADLSAQTMALIDFEPHVIIAAAADEFLDKIVPVLENNWQGAEGTEPFYLLSPFHVNNPSLNPLLDAEPTVRARLVGVNGPSAVDQTLYNTYQLAFDAAYMEVAGTRGFENFYDAAYYLVYAAAAAGNVLETGDDLRRGMARLLSGPEYGVGIANRQMEEALQALLNGSITLNGTLGPPNFDSNTGARTDVGSVWCIDQFRAQRSDVLRYDASSGGFTGTFPCFSGF